MRIWMYINYLYLCFLIILIAIFCVSCSHQIKYNDPIPVHESFEIYSDKVGETRVINVWIPEKYKDSAVSLPVMYMADGGIVDEDFPHIANTFEKLLNENKIMPMMLVGITNTQRRRDLSGPTEIASDKSIAPIVGGSAEFRSFISEELIPEIEKRYRTTPVRGILGESLSGLFVMETFLLQPDLFDIYIAFDPSLWWNNHKMADQSPQYLNKFSNDKKILWFAGSDAEDIFPYTKQLAGILQKINLSQLKWKYVDMPNQHHNTIFRAAKEEAFVWALGVNQ